MLGKNISAADDIMQALARNATPSTARVLPSLSRRERVGVRGSSNRDINSLTVTRRLRNSAQSRRSERVAFRRKRVTHFTNTIPLFPVDDYGDDYGGRLGEFSS